MACFDAAATANNYLLLFGAFENFVVVDRLGSTLELVPHLGTGRRSARTARRLTDPQ
jgi:predicted phage gp36 major capsid-like protein